MEEGRVTLSLLQIKCGIDCKFIIVICWMNEVGGRELGLSELFQAEVSSDLMLWRKIISCSAPITFFAYFSLAAFPAALCLVSGTIFLYFGLMQTVIPAFGFLLLYYRVFKMAFGSSLF